MTNKDLSKEKLIKLIYGFRQLVIEEKFDETRSYLNEIFFRLELSKDVFGGNLRKMLPVAEKEATIFASAIAQMVTSPSFVMRRNIFELLTKNKRVVSQTFEISGYRGTGHFIDMFSTFNEDGSQSISSENIPKLFSVLSINALTKPLLNLLFKQSKDISWPVARAFLTEQLVYNPLSEEIRSLIIAKSHIWADCKATDAVINTMGPVYMGCSYVDAPNKHEVKKTVNHIVRDWLMRKGLKDVNFTGKKRVIKEKPTLIVMAELYTAVHAMHRCYGPAIRALREHFKLVYMSAEGKCDPLLEYMFDVIDTSKLDKANPKAFFEKVKTYRPDVIYYPSIGMRALSLYGSNLRLAPVQLMTYGHPATTHSKYIDYSLVVEGLVGADYTIADKIIYWHEVARYEHRHDAEKPVAQIRENASSLKIAVPAWARKITPRLLTICQEIEKRSSKPVEFVFFPNGAGAIYQAFKRRIEFMCSAKVEPRNSYNGYIDELSKCDIFLSSIPFGATNGILDACPLGLPMVNMKGAEVHAMNDSEMVSHMPQPDWLSTNNDEEYISAVLRLIENDEERVEISKALAAFDFDKVMMVDPEGSCPSFGRAVRFAYEYHEDIQASDQKSFSTQEVGERLSEKAA
ncbi:hypothetical protein KFE96_07005 [Kordiimonas sp. SCSIO 12603]|uniref:hypothetical protein n=1 Tax=Kordiimonas sp. SCSIO 12603 TaxID=2829596 RepID=UPI0021025CD7|nr:hypothetical protein [Kordiimonas sp. SCSIO 12603]UTW60051.1 hypothetical protein KFE96_07005 [Kordiimonas sp. SCSIO 12603]